MPIKFSYLLTRAIIPLLVLWLFISASLLSRTIVPSQPPFPTFSQSVYNFFYWISESGGKYGAPAIALLCLILFSLQTRYAKALKFKSFIIFALVGGAFAGSGSMLNEHVIKEALQVPRPNIVWLAGNDSSGPLGMSPEQFYKTGDKQARRAVLTIVLSQLDKNYELTPKITAHWQQEAGYSMPSGHAFSALFFSSLLMLLAVTFLEREKQYFFYLLLPWAALVCYSRLILRVHTPIDITLGSLQGLFVGCVAYLVTLWVCRKLQLFDQTATNFIHN
jgi:phosphatidylglycerophosphatase B